MKARRHVQRPLTAEDVRQLGRDCLYNPEYVETFISHHRDGDGRLVALNTRTMKKEVITSERWLQRLLFAFCTHRQWQEMKDTL